MASIVKRKSSKGTRYQAHVRRIGHPAQSRTFTRLTDAKKWAQGVETDIERGEFQPVARGVTFTDLVRRYEKSPEYADLSGGEQRKRSMHLKWWTDQLKNPTLDRLLDGSLILGALEECRRSGRSGATCNRYQASLRKCLAYGVKHRIIPDNPARGLGSAKEKGRVRRLTNDERRRLLDACDESSEPRLYPLVLLALASGGRQGELLGLTWDDVDFDRGRLQFLNTKNGDTRGVGVSREVLAVLRDRLVRHVNGLVFAAPDGKARWPRTAWDRELREAKINDFRFHDCRHDFASRLAESRATLAELAEALGHRTLAMVKRYAHLTEGHVVEVTRAASEALLR